MKIAIVGAGLAGLCAARSLLDAGEGELTVFESRAGPGLETSHANGALLHPSAVEPWNSPGILRFVLANLGNPRSPVLLRPRALPSLLGWGARFVHESAPARHRAHTLANVALALRSVQLMQGLRDEGIEYGAAQRGSLAIHRDAAAFAEAQERARWLREHGVPSRVLSRDEALALEPALAPIAGTLVGALHNTGDECGDAYRFCLAVGARLESRGVAFRWSTSVQALRAERGVLAGLCLADGREEPFDAVVLAAAWWSVALASRLGLKLPVRPVKGYSLTLPQPDDANDGTDAAAGPPPRTPIVDHDLHIAVVPVVGDRLRVAGTAEFCGEDRRLDPARIGNLMQLLLQLYPALAGHAKRAPRQEWTGLRPMCADGKPLIGATRVPGLYLNTGHGQLGWTTAAASGELLAAAVTRRAPPIDAAPFLPSRFGL
ncbi:MAG: FAD-dependent oxidoreductase [Burkholderiales bacterium]|nr:FAD-dependent oxidoreductase [Burkholderiales bacterium]